jgi:hypothetical protein
MNWGSNYYNGNSYGNNYAQSQMQDYSQLQKQKQDLVHCNNSFGMLLSSMESLFIKSNYNISVLFGHYNHFNDISWKTRDQIKSQVYTDLMAYKIQKLAYKQKYGKFDYPDFPPIQEVIAIVEQWKKMAKEKEEKNLCDEILDLINDKNERPISYYQGRVQNTRSYNRADPVQSFQFSNKIHDQIDARNESINNDLYKDPNTKYGLEIGKKPGTSEFSSLRRSIDTIPKDQKQAKDENDIVAKVNDLISKYQEYMRSYSYLNINEGKECDKLLDNINSKITKYVAKYQNLDFLRDKIHVDNEIKRVKDFSKYLSHDPKKNELLNKLLSLFLYIKNYESMS